MVRQVLLAALFLLVAANVAADTICATESVRVFYERRGNALAWFDGQRLNPDAAVLIAAIESAGANGLRPGDYHLATIKRLATAPGEKARELDTLLTDAFLLLAAHLTTGRIDPLTIEPTWCLPPRSFDTPAVLQAALDNHVVAETLQRLPPAHAGYRALRRELARLREIEKRGGWSTELATRLGVPPGGDLTEAVRHFQHLHGLEEDGKPGPATLRELNVPIADRIRQIEINLERWRWLPSTLGDRYVVINIPQFRLRVIEDGREVLAMNVVVGKDFQRTPVFSSEITQVILSPYWNIPASIANKEVWPKHARDRSYFKREHIEVVGDRLRQKPGPWNALGFVKFNLPNRHGVYLHDTPSQSYFQRAVRTFSHGCIRIEKPVDLASYLLRDDPAWSVERVVETSRAGRECAVEIRERVPVHILYWTAYVGDDDELHFAPDVYGKDRLMMRGKSSDASNAK